MKNFIVEDIEKDVILKMHKSLLKEQTQDVNLVKLSQAVIAGCLKNGSLKVKKSTGEYFYRKPSAKDPNKEVDFFANMTYKFSDGSKSGKWVCPEIANIVASQEAKAEVEKTKLDDNQTKVLELLKPKGWFHEPAPTDVEVDQGLFEKLNLADIADQSKNPYGFEYGKWFSKKFPTGFYIYKKIVGQEKEKTTKGTKVEISAQSCKAAIESLYNNMTSPHTYPLTAEDLKSYKDTTTICSEPANKQKFILRFALKNKLDKLLKEKII